MTSHSRFIRDRIHLFGTEKLEASSAVWHHPDFRELYPELLLRVYDVVKGVTQLNECARDRALAMAETDPVCAILAPYLTVHTEEERGHDLWLLEDLERLGVSAGRALERVPSPFAAALVGAQYYWIHEAHPIAIIGYMAVLEWEHPGPEVYEGFAESTGLPIEAFSTFQRHAILDEPHCREMAEMVDRLPLTDFHRELLGLSILHTSRAIGALYRGLLDSRVTTLSR